MNKKMLVPVLAFVGGIVATIFMPDLQLKVAKLLGKEPIAG